MIDILKLEPNGRKLIDVTSLDDLGRTITMEMGLSATAVVNVETSSFIFYDPACKGEINAVASTLLDDPTPVRGAALLACFNGEAKPGNIVGIKGRTAWIINSLYDSLDSARNLGKNTGVPYTLTENIFSAKSIVHHMQMLLGYDAEISLNVQINKAALEIMQNKKVDKHDLWIYCLALDALRDTLFSRMDEAQKNLYNDIAGTGCHITVDLDGLKNGGKNEQTD